MISHAFAQVGFWFSQNFSWAPPWMWGLLEIAVAVGAALLFYRWVVRLLHKLVGRFSPFLQILITRCRDLVGAILVIAALSATIPAANLGYPATLIILHLLLVAFILALGWGGLIALGLTADLYLRRFHTDAEDNLLARKHVTQVKILVRAGSTLVVLISIGAALMTYGTVRQYGLSLFASAGAAGLVVGLAARPVLSNMLAGIQIAITQPIRLEDAVIVEGEWGWIETITSTYVVVRLWDWRRMILPISYFIEKPFQNWTYESAALIGTVLLYVDYSVPVDRVREKLEEIAKASPRWDGKVVNLSVTDATDRAVQLRALVSARNAGITFDLRCEVREKLIAFLQAEYPHALPRQRAEIGGQGPGPGKGPRIVPQPDAA